MNAPAQCALHPDRTASSVCPRCGAFTCAECNPTGQSHCPTCQQRTGSDRVLTPTPWERRGELGFVQAVWQTWRQSVLEPGRFWAQLDPAGPALDAFLYGWLLTALTSVLQIPFLMLNFAQMQGQLAQLGKTLEELPAPAQAFMDLFMTNPVRIALLLSLWGLLVFPVSALLGAALPHLGLKVSGSDKPFSTTLRVVCYAVAPNVLTAIPVVGGFAGLYTLVLEVWGLREAHGVSTGRAVFAVLWPVLVFGCCAGVGVVALIAAFASRLG